MNTQNKIDYIKNYINKISCIYIPINNENNIDIIYDLYKNNIEPDFNKKYDSIVYLYYSLYCRNIKKNYNQANEILSKGIEIIDDDVNWCYNELGYHTNNVELIKKGFKYNNIFSLILLMFLHHIKISPKYYIKFYEHKNDMIEFCKREKLLTYNFGCERYDNMTPKELSIDSYTEYINNIFNEYNELLLKFNNDELFPIYEKYFIDFQNLEELQIWKDYNNEDSEKIDTIIKLDTPEKKNEYWICRYYIYKMEKYITKLKEELKYLPGIGEEYFNAQNDFDMLLEKNI
jgi:hypothetical protein